MLTHPDLVSGQAEEARLRTETRRGQSSSGAYVINTIEYEVISEYTLGTVIEYHANCIIFPPSPVVAMS